MRNSIAALLPALVSGPLLCCQTGGSSPPITVPSPIEAHDPWAVETCPGQLPPVEQEKIDRALDQAMASGSGGILVLKSGCVLAERYAEGFGPDSLFVSDSVAKSVTATLIGRALFLGIFENLDRPVCQYLEQWPCGGGDAHQSTVSLRHLLTLSSGLDWRENWQTYELDDIAGLLNADDQLAYVAARPFRHTPGQRFSYSTGDVALLAGVLDAALGPGVSLADFGRSQLFAPLGIQDFAWAKDAKGRTLGYGELKLRLRDYARIGLLYLQNGRWRDQRLLAPEWVREATQAREGLHPWLGHGYLWHLHLPGRLSPPQPPPASGQEQLATAFTNAAPDGLPRRMFWAEGFRGQYLMVLPEQDLVVVRMPAEHHLERREWHVGNFLKTLLATELPAVSPAKPRRHPLEYAAPRPMACARPDSAEFEGRREFIVQRGQTKQPHSRSRWRLGDGRYFLQIEQGTRREAGIVDSQGNARCWSWFDPSSKTDFSAQRAGDDLEIAGQLRGKQVQRRLKLPRDEAWCQSWLECVEAHSEAASVHPSRFWAVEDERARLHHWVIEVAHHQPPPGIDVDRDWRGYEITFTDWKRSFWRAHYWLHPNSPLAILRAMRSDGPGSSVEVLRSLEGD